MRFLLFACAVVLLAGCGTDDHDQSTAGSAAEVDVEVAVYSVRGVIADLPPEGQPLDWMAIQHEAIPDFVGIGGDVEPMHEMTMRFPVAPEVDLTSAAVGDKIAFELEVDWNAGEPARVVALSSLPPETELELGSM